MKNRKGVILLGLLALVLLPQAAFGANPSVISFSANPTDVGYGITSTLSWTLANASGASLTVFCPDGVTVTNATTAANFPCSSRTYLGQYASDYIPLNIINISGNTKNVLVRLTPRDISGADFEQGNSDINLTVATSPQPIFSFSSPASTRSESPLTLSWATHDIPGVNLIFGCVNGVTVLDPSNTNVNLACGSLAFSSKQAANGSISITFKNTTDASSTIPVTLVPAITGESYDLSHGMQIAVEVGPKPAPIVATINSFTASNLTPTSETPVIFSWTSTNATGVNMIINCGNVSVYSSTTTLSSNSLPCGNVLFNQSLASAGNSTLVFKNATEVNQNVTISLIPEVSAGFYNAGRAAKVDLVVKPKNWQPPAVSAPILPNSTPVINSGVNQNQTPVAAILKRSLFRGSRGDDVKALQRYFLKSPKTYSGMLETGYFGPATERAVKIFQVAQGIAKPGDAGYGYVGPKTRAILNPLLRQ